MVGHGPLLGHFSWSRLSCRTQCSGNTIGELPRRGSSWLDLTNRRGWAMGRWCVGLCGLQAADITSRWRQSPGRIQSEWSCWWGCPVGRHYGASSTVGTGRWDPLIAGHWPRLGLERCSCQAACSQGRAVGALQRGAGDGLASSLSCGWWGSSGWSRASDGLGGRCVVGLEWGEVLSLRSHSAGCWKPCPSSLFLLVPQCSHQFPLVCRSGDRCGPLRQWPKGLRRWAFASVSLYPKGEITRGPSGRCAKWHLGEGWWKRPNYSWSSHAVFLRFWFGVGSILNCKLSPVFSQKHSPSWMVGSLVFPEQGTSYSASMLKLRHLWFLFFISRFTGWWWCLKLAMITLNNFDENNRKTLAYFWLK